MMVPCYSDEDQRSAVRSRDASGAPRASRRVALATLFAVIAASGMMSAASASALDGTWGFEQVTPVDKRGGNVASIDTFRASEDGGRLLYTATAPFRGAPVDSSPMYVRYVGEKVDGTWTTRAVDPPFDVIPPGYLNYIMGVVGSSVDLSHVLVTSTRALAPGATPGGSNLYLRNVSTGAYRLVATAPDSTLTRELTSPLGATAVFHVAPGGTGVIFLTAQRLTSDAPTDGAGVLYGWTPARGLYVISRLPEDEGGAAVGGLASDNSEYGVRRAVPVRGAMDRVYFAASTFDDSGSWIRGGVYLREENDSVAVSRSEISGTVEPARIVSWTADGEYALLATLTDGAPLTSDTPVDPSQSFPSYLYRYQRSSGSLEYVGTLSPQAWPPGDVLQLSADGRTVVFQSSFELAPGAVGGAANMFVWRDGELRFVTASAALSSTESLGNFTRQLSGNGRYLAFTDNSPSSFVRAGKEIGDPICAGSFGMVGNCDEVFVYDTETDAFACASCRPAGVTQRGASGDPGIGSNGYIRMDQHQAQTVSDDGTVWFTSQNDLLPGEDANGRPDVYAYRAGETRLVSRGRQGASARFLDATADGGTAFIATDDPIGPNDHDEDVDIYATGQRIEARPEIVPDPPPGPCAGSDCRAPGARHDGGGSPPESAANSDGPSAPVRSLRPTVKVVRSRWTGSIGRVSVRVSGAGRVRVSGSRIRAGARNVTRSGTYVVRVRLNKSGTARKKRNGRVAVRMRVSFSPPFGRSVVSSSRKVVR